MELWAGVSKDTISGLDSESVYAVLAVAGLLLSPDPIPDGLVLPPCFGLTSIVFLLILKWF